MAGVNGNGSKVAIGILPGAGTVILRQRIWASRQGSPNRVEEKQGRNQASKTRCERELGLGRIRVMLRK
ncbi:hypothetical protein NDU88_002229 [Pleurodeles waltl]|uniref:Uncharacterized protein n=1 Tax=Pleurodeles waltl TaxID=8319 RepID=A0AAV7LBR0_PLEWA|nr:hypothetical protein NDU88_002229 [Pleurodeles waltl]